MVTMIIRISCQSTWIEQKVRLCTKKKIQINLLKDSEIHVKNFFLSDGRVFVTAIRNNGVPASLSVVSDQQGPSGPLLKPYPSWSWYKKGDCDGITSVYRVAVRISIYSCVNII